MTEINENSLRRHLLERESNSHKGDYGHLLIVAGCDSMPGAAHLATRSALVSGCGLVTLHTTRFAAYSLVSDVPSAMLSIDSGSVISEMPCNIEKYTAIAVGPGIGKDSKTLDVLTKILEYAGINRIPCVLDADALNLIADNPVLFRIIPDKCVITPHMGELKRLEAKLNMDDIKGKCVLVVKGHRTRIYSPLSDTVINTTGNPGMAKGGSGDVLTGLLGGLIARGYDVSVAASMAVWIHGYAGDYCSKIYGMESYNSKHLADNLYIGFKKLYGND